MIASNIIILSVLSIFLWNLEILCESVGDERIVETNNGKIRGKKLATIFKKIEYYAFKGIPYAKAPVGELRFKAPEPIDSWAPQVKDAFYSGDSCMQTNAFNQNIKPLSENCLFLNVYVPANVTSDEKLAVMVFIHSGGFAEGSATETYSGPDFLVEQNVIFVTMMYRLGVFGFLSLGTPEYSGNMGLKDQQMALQWIYTNIEQFSGDNKRIMLMGVSAGSASTHFHMLSRESRKYFQRAMLSSGSIDNYWALSEESNHLRLAYEMSKQLGEPKDSLDELVNFLKTVPADQIVEYGSAKTFYRRRATAAIGPIIERENAIRPFITESPEKNYDTSEIHIDALFSYSSSEAILFYDGDEITDLKGLDGNFTLELPFRGATDLKFDSTKYQQIANQIRQFYFKDLPVDENSLKQYIDLLGDMNFIYGIEKAARRHANKTSSKSFLLRFSADTMLSISKYFVSSFEIVKKLPGASHEDDFFHFASVSELKGLYDSIVSQDDAGTQLAFKISDTMTKLLTNFAKFGEPTHNDDPVVGFYPIQNDRVHFLDITNDGLKLGVNPNEKSYELWADIERQIRQN